MNKLLIILSLVSMVATQTPGVSALTPHQKAKAKAAAQGRACMAKKAAIKKAQAARNAAAKKALARKKAQQALLLKQRKPAAGGNANASVVKKEQTPANTTPAARYGKKALATAGVVGAATTLGAQNAYNAYNAGRFDTAISAARSAGTSVVSGAKSLGSTVANSRVVTGVASGAKSLGSTVANSRVGTQIAAHSYIAGAIVATPVLTYAAVRAYKKAAAYLAKNKNVVPAPKKTVKTTTTQPSRFSKYIPSLTRATVVKALGFAAIAAGAAYGFGYIPLGQNAMAQSVSAQVSTALIANKIVNNLPSTDALAVDATVVVPSQVIAADLAPAPAPVAAINAAPSQVIPGCGGCLFHNK